MTTLLSIDPLGDLAERLSSEFKPGIIVKTVKSAEEALAMCEWSEIDAVIFRLSFEEANGLDAFDQFREADPHLPVIILADKSDSETAIEAIMRGAFEFLNEPIDFERLRAVIDQAVRIRHISTVPVSVLSEGESSVEGQSFIGRCSEMTDVFKQIGKVARQNVTVLIRGESGTGKELVARAIFQHGDRPGNRFMAVNCAAIPDNLLESELFGHEKGSFTGATSRRIGRFEVCNGGTLFLDEVGDMSPLVQSKVLRALQDQQFERVGGSESIRTDVRVIAATNQSLEEMVEAGTFREDLYYRLKEVTISLPPLRERVEDLPLLIEHFLTEHARLLKRGDLEGISEPALRYLLNYDWPGNVRELENVIKQSVINASGPVIIPEFLPAEVLGIDPYTIPPGLETSAEKEEVRTQGTNETDLSQLDLAAFIDQRLHDGSHQLYSEAVEELERYLFRRVLEATEGNQSQAAEILGITRGKVRDRIQVYHLSLDTNVVVEE